MTLRTVRLLRAANEALRNLAGGALLVGGFIALCRLAELVTIR